MEKAKEGESEALQGSCCCGRVRFRARGPYGSFSHCHCTDCRKSHGAAFASYLGVAIAHFDILEGGDDVGGFTTASGTRRTFCRQCGSTLTGTVSSEPEMIYIAAGTLDTPPRSTPAYHLFVRSKVPWFELRDGLPQHREYPE